MTDLFVAINIEIRSGNLKPNDLKNRIQQSMTNAVRRHIAEKRNETPESSPFSDATHKYPTIDLTNQIFEDKVLEDIFEYGIFNKDRITASISNSPHFTDLSEVPPWKQIIQYRELDDKIVTEALSKLDIQFNDRAITTPGEMLHIFSIRLMLAENGIIEYNLEKIQSECIQYIDDLLARHLLPPIELDSYNSDRPEESYDGYGYWVTETYRVQFNSIRDRLAAARKEALEATFPDRLQDLFTILRTDGIEFYRQLCHTAGHGSPYAEVPLLKVCAPENFVDEWINAPKANRQWVRRALEDRLEPRRVQNTLASEREFGLKILKILKNDAANSLDLSA